MKRFIDLRYQGTGHRFAWWDTGIGLFDAFDGEQAWTTWDHFRGSVRQEEYNLGREARVDDLLARYHGLTPAWAHIPPASDRELVGFPEDGRDGWASRPGDVGDAEEALIQAAIAHAVDAAGEEIWYRYAAVLVAALKVQASRAGATPPAPASAPIAGQPVPEHFSTPDRPTSGPAVDKNEVQGG